MAETVVLMDKGNRYSTGISVDGNSATAIYWSRSARPDLTSVTLPELGDKWTDPIHGAQAYLILSNIDRVPIVDDHTIGYEYVCTYQNQSVATWDPFQQPDISPAVSSITTAAEYDSWQYGGTTSSQTSASSGVLYFNVSGADVIKLVNPQSIHRLSCVVNLSVTKRVTTSFTDILTEGVSYTGKVNDATWNGINIGNVLCTGMVATPLAQVLSGVGNAITYNRTLGFAIKVVPGDGENNWQKIFYEGSYGKLYKDAARNQGVLLYEYESLPTDLS